MTTDDVLIAVSRSEIDAITAAKDEIDSALYRAMRELYMDTYAPWRKLDPEAFDGEPAPLSLVPRLRRRLPDQWACGEARFDTEAEAREFADKYNARVSRVKRWRVPKGTRAVQAFIDALVAFREAMPPLDEMEARRRAAVAKYRATPVFAGLAAWLPNRIGGETKTESLVFGESDG